MWQSRVGAGVLVARRDRILMVLRERSGEIRWELPSGLLEHGESLEEAALRETFEETGLSVAIGSLLCTVVMDVPDESYRGLNAYFRASTEGHQIPRVGEGEPIHRVDFVDVTMLRPRTIHPVDRRILNLWRRKPERPPFYVHVTL